MKFTTIKKFSALVLVATFISVGAAHAETIGVVDLESVLKNSDAMKDAQSKISKKQAGFQKEIDKKQETLEKESKQVNAKKNILSDEAFAKEQEAFGKKVDDLKTLVTSRQDTLKKASLDAIATINDKVKDAVNEVRKEKNLDIVIASTSAIYYKDELDISADVTKKLNKKISKIEVK